MQCPNCNKKISAFKVFPKKERLKDYTTLSCRFNCHHCNAKLKVEGDKYFPLYISYRLIGAVPILVFIFLSVYLIPFKFIWLIILPLAIMVGAYYGFLNYRLPLLHCKPLLDK